MKRVSQRMRIEATLVALLVVAAWASARAEETAPAQPVRAVSWEKLASLLPDALPGMEAGEIEGATVTAPGFGITVSHSYAEREYTASGPGGQRRIKVTVTDTGSNVALLAPYAMVIEYDSPDGSMKTAEIGGHRAVIVTEKEDGQPRHHQVVVIVGNRALVLFEADAPVGAEELLKLAKSFDYATLASWLK